MELNIFQHTLAKIYTDKHYRDLFFNDPKSAITPFNRESGYVQQLLRLKEEQVEMFAQGLINKRFGAVKNLLPLSYQYLGHQFKTDFQCYAESKTLQSGPHKHIIDAIGYCDYLLSILPKEQFLQNVIKYERLINTSANVQKKVIWNIFSIPVHQMHLKDFSLEARRITVIILIRPSSKSRLWKLLFCI